MAKKQSQALDSIFKSTEPEPKEPPEAGEVPATGRTLSVGVGLKESEVEMLDTIAEELDVARNAVMRYAIRYFLAQYQKNEVNPAKDVKEPEVKKQLKMP